MIASLGIRSYRQFIIGIEALNDLLANESPAAYPRELHWRIPKGADLTGISRDLLIAGTGHGLARIVLDDAVNLSRETGGRHPGLDALRLIRECVGLGIGVEWALQDLGGVDPRWLGHLPPPMPGNVVPDWFRATWDAWAFGLLYWRRGPGFAFVRDVRMELDAGQVTLEEADGALGGFMAVQEPRRLADTEGLHAEALQILREERLTVEVAGWVLALPYRVHRWPIPYSAV